MSSTTTDRNHPGINKDRGDGQNEAYIVLSDEEIEKGYIRPFRDAYIHDECGSLTTMQDSIAATYARDPKFYGSTFCVKCGGHFPVAEFNWDGTDERVGS